MGPVAAAGDGTGGTGLAASAQPADGDSVDLLKVVAVPMAKRFAPALAGLLAGGVLGFLLGRRGRKAGPSEDLLAALSRLVS